MVENSSHRTEKRPSLLDNIIRFFLEQKLVVFLMVIALVAGGVAFAPFDWKTGAFPRRPVPTDAIPDIGENQQIVFTKWMGRSPQDVEDQITYPLTVALLGIPEVRTVRSYSMFGFSSIYVIFTEKAEFYWSRSRVVEKLASLPAGTLPSGVKPALGPDATALGQIFWYTLEGRDKEGNPTRGWGLDELRSIQDWDVRYALLSVEGVSEVASIGGFVKEYQVDVDPDAMRAYGVTLEDVFRAVRMSNVDVGARTIEVNRAEYVVRGIGFIKEVADLEGTVVKVRDNVPIYVRNVAHVSLGPAFRRGALDKEGVEAVGGVVVVRYGENPLATIKRLHEKINQIAPSLPKKTLPDGRESQVTIVPFYDRTELIHETLGTLRRALTEEILITIIVVVVMVMHLRSSGLISAMLPLAVCMCFIAMKLGKVDANIVALSGIAIAIGTIVDMGIVVCENILKHLNEAGSKENPLEVVYRATREVGSAVLTAIATTVVSFLPVFTMTAAEGKLFKPLAYTKTFAILASVVIALTMLPAFAHIFLARKIKASWVRRTVDILIVTLGVGLALFLSGWVGFVLILVGAYRLAEPHLPEKVTRWSRLIANGLAVLVVAVVLTGHWLPLGPERGMIRNFVFVGLLAGGTLGFFKLYEWVYGPILRWCLRFKLVFLALPLLAVVFGFAYVWQGPGKFFGPMEEVSRSVFTDRTEVEKLIELRLLETRGKNLEKATLLWSNTALSQNSNGMESMLEKSNLRDPKELFEAWLSAKEYAELKKMKWKRLEDILQMEEGIQDDAWKELGLPGRIRFSRTKWTLAHDWDGRGREFMPPLDEGSYLWMPTTMPHASIGEAMDILRKQNMAIRMIPEVKSVVGKLGRAETPLDPAPISMIETVINYKPEYKVDKRGHRIFYRFDPDAKDVFRTEKGEPVLDAEGKTLPVQGRYFWKGKDKDKKLEEDRGGRPFRLWRPHIKKPDDIWDEIVKAGKIPGSTGAPRLQPISARLVMLQSGMRAPMGIKVKGADLKVIERVCLDIERLLKSGEVPSIQTSAVIADRIVGKAYLELDWDRGALDRYGVHIARAQMMVEVAIGGMPLTTTVEGRERYPVRVRYMRELRDTIESLSKILVTAMDGTQIPVAQLLEQQVEIRLDPEAVERAGVDAHEVGAAIRKELLAAGIDEDDFQVGGDIPFPIRVRKAREFNRKADRLENVRIEGKSGESVPVIELLEFSYPREPWYKRGPMVIKSEDTELIGYVLFDMKPGNAEVDVVEAARRYLEAKEGEFERASAAKAKVLGRDLTREEKEGLPGLDRRNCKYVFAGNYENQVRSQRTLMIVLPVALFIIFLILYFQFKAVTTSFLVFSGIAVAWAGGFLMLWLYAQPWFLDFSLFGVDLRELFQVHSINLSVAVWVGFLALFGIASDNGVIVATYLDQSFDAAGPTTREAIHEATLAAGLRRIRPCLMTTATTILALIPVLTSTGRGSDVMVPMAIPSFGGMLLAVLTTLVVPVLYAAVAEIRLKLGLPAIRPKSSIKD